MSKFFKVNFLKKNSVQMIDWLVTICTSIASIKSFNDANTFVAVLTAISSISIIGAIIIRGLYQNRISNQIFTSIPLNIEKYKRNKKSSFNNVEFEKEYVFLELSKLFDNLSIKKLKKYISEYYELNRDN